MSRSIKCKSCGYDDFFRVNKDTIECKACGVQFRNKSFVETQKNDHQQEYIENLENDTQKSQVEKEDRHTFLLVKLLLCIFLGHFGVHKFMEGKVFMGILYIFTYGLFGIGIICDIISIIKELIQKNGEH